MKRVTRKGAQGDVLFTRVKVLPPNYEVTEDLVVAHSETGHHHVAVGDVQRYQKANDAMISYLVAKGPVQIEHHRSFNTHETLELFAEDAGEVVWEIRRPRESIPGGWRRIED